MAEQVTYYSISGSGVLRRVRGDHEQWDEAFDHGDHTWKHTSLLYSYERGDSDNELYEISEDEANRIVERIKSKAG